MGSAAMSSTYLFILLILLPIIQFHKEEYRLFTEPIKVAVPKNNPALSALQDMRLDLTEAEIPFEQNHFEIKNEVLVSGAISKKIEPKKIETFNSLKVAVASDLPNMHDLEGNLLPLRERLALMETHLTRQARSDLNSTTWRDVAANLLASSNTEDITEAKEKSWLSTTGTKIVVTKNENSKNKMPTKPSREFPTPVEKVSKPDVNEQRNNENKKEESNLDIRTAQIISEEREKTSYKISGEILLGGGLAYTGGETYLNIFREWNGQVEDVGSFFPAEAKYEIEVQELTGFIVIELTNKDGQVLGAAEADLFTWEQTPLLNSNIEGVHFLIEPVKKGFIVEYFSARDLSRKITEELVKWKYHFWDRWLQFKKGLYLDQEVLRGSQTWVQTKALKSWKTLGSLQTQGVSRLATYPYAYLESLALSLDKKLDIQKGWVAGQIIGPDGLPLSGAKIEIAGVESEAKVFYFENLENNVDWPNKKIKVTQENGKFIAMNLDPGNYLLRVNYKNQILPAEYVWVQSETVTHTQLNYGSERYVGINLKDPIFNVERLGAKIRVLGLEQEAQVYGNSHDRISFPSGYGNLTIEADAGTEYLLSKKTMDRNSRNLDFHLVPEKWFNQLLKSTSKSKLAQHGHVFGTVLGEEFEVIVTNELGEEVEAEVVYFNKSGEYLDQKYGAVDGGFIILNLPEVWTQITILPTNDKKIFVKSVLPDQDLVETLHINFN
jgi:hypothetical protein